jgi:hypothetical protein
LIICEVCGAANVEYDEQCRICGNQLTPGEAQPSAVAANTLVDRAPAQIAPPATWGQTPPQDRMASMGQAPATSASPLLGNPAHHDEDLLGAAPEPELPPFMQTTARPLSAPEPVQLISASDLPEWIRQIAEADRAKAEAEAVERAAHVEATPVKAPPSFANDSKAAGPSTRWLSKTAAVTNDAVDPWSVSEPSVPAGQSEATMPPQFVAYPTVTPTPVYMTESREKSKRQARMPRFAKAEKVATTEPRRPIYRNTAVQIALLVLLVVALAALLV